MTAYIKVKGLDKVARVIDVEKIEYTAPISESCSEITDFKKLRIYPEYQYVFVGTGIFHVLGENIECVWFE
jgi:hypothetical protein|nr:MAG TPA: hypothetical protein [Caudoviricetes sp.]